MIKIIFPPEKLGIQTFHDDSKRHLSNTIHNRSLHFEAVHEGDFVLALHPHGVEPERIHALWIVLGEYAFVLVQSEAPSPEDVQRQTHKVVVNQTHVRSEKSHQHKKVFHLQKHLQVFDLL